MVLRDSGVARWVMVLPSLSCVVREGAAIGGDVTGTDIGSESSARVTRGRLGELRGRRVD
jgi:hypothetical protein